MVKFEDLLGNKRAGKAVLKLALLSKLLPPCMVSHLETDLVVAVTNQGRMWAFPIKDLPILPRGKGNKIIQIPSAKAKSREEFVVHIAVIGENQSLKLLSGKRYFTLDPSDLAHYRGERGRRGRKLPRGYQRVDALIPE